MEGERDGRRGDHTAGIRGDLDCPRVGRRGELTIMWLTSEGRWVPGRFLRAKGRFEYLRIREGTVAEMRLRG